MWCWRVTFLDKKGRDLLMREGSLMIWIPHNLGLGLLCSISVDFLSTSSGSVLERVIVDFLPHLRDAQIGRNISSFSRRRQVLETKYREHSESLSVDEDWRSSPTAGSIADSRSRWTFSQGAPERCACCTTTGKSGVALTLVKGRSSCESLPNEVSCNR